MVDKDIVLAKTSAAKKHLKRIDNLSQTPVHTFLNDNDVQDIALFNIQMAVQNCIDMAAHIISEAGLGTPGSTNEMFYCLEENGYIDRQLSEKMVKAVGFRNLVVHEYGKLDLKRVHRIIQDDIRDIDEFLKVIIKKTGL